MTLTKKLIIIIGEKSLRQQPIAIANSL